MKPIAKWLVLVLELVLVAFLGMTEAKLAGWSQLSADEFKQSPDAMYLFQQVVWQSGLAFGLLAGLLLAILIGNLTKSAQPPSQGCGVSNGWGWFLLCPPLIALVFDFAYK